MMVAHEARARETWEAQHDEGRGYPLEQRVLLVAASRNVLSWLETGLTLGCMRVWGSTRGVDDAGRHVLT